MKTLDPEAASHVLGLVAKEIRRQEGRMAEGRSGGQGAEDRLEALERAVDALSTIKDGTSAPPSAETDTLDTQAANIGVTFGVRVSVCPMPGPSYTISLPPDVTIPGLTAEQAGAVLYGIARSAEAVRDQHADSETPA